MAGEPSHGLVDPSQLVYWTDAFLLSSPPLSCLTSSSQKSGEHLGLPVAFVYLFCYGKTKPIPAFVVILVPLGTIPKVILDGLDISNGLLVCSQQLDHAPVRHHQCLQSLELVEDSRSFGVLHARFIMLCNTTDG